LSTEIIESLANTIIWLEDVVEEISEDVERLIAAGFEVMVARGFREIDEHLKTVQRTEGKQVHAIILDIMIEGVSDIGRFFPGISNGQTAHGYAAGLVFLERVLENHTLYKFCQTSPVFLRSKRALNHDEQGRIENLRNQAQRKIHVTEKASTKSIYDKILTLKQAGSDGSRQ
jgi:hypothetical protein